LQLFAIIFVNANHGSKKSL